MPEFLVSQRTNPQFRHHILFPDLELLEPPPLFYPPSPKALGPFSRGPMYSTYAKLRERRRRLKKVRYAPSTPIPLPPKRSVVPRSVDRSFSLLKENRTPPMRSNAFTTPPPPPASTPELRKSVSVSVRKLGEKKRGTDGLFLARRSFAGFNELKEIPIVSVRGINGDGNKGSLRKSVAVLERSKLMKAMG